MSMDKTTPFEIFLHRHDEEAWSAVLTDLARSIHEVDKTATQIWFAFYPLALWQALAQADDPERLAAQLLLKGNYELKNQIDSSHHFLYGHRYWPEVKKALEEHAASFQETNAQGADLASRIREVARRAASLAKRDESLLAGITAVAFMTAQQVGLEAFKAAPGALGIDRKHAGKSPEQILKERAKDNNQGLFGFLRTVDKEWTVTFDENEDGANFKLRDTSDLAFAASSDKRDYHSRDPRRIEGPIPVECRSASCGTCWVGVLGGAEKLSDVGAREGKKIKEFGYVDTNEPKPLIRLACMAQASGAVSIVIPPWNGVFGKQLRGYKTEEQLEAHKTDRNAVAPKNGGPLASSLEQ
ncbi:MAG: 2Fe-2S iron-sulfur cluster-binding protein [Pyrinomonadaceae bacterium]